MTIIIFDTETTTAGPDKEVIEAAWLELESINPLVIKSEYLEQFKPSKPISIGAMATHHIMDEDLINCRPSSEFKLPEGTQYIIGHKVDFDWEVIGKPDVKRICTLAMARYLWPNLDAHTQTALIYHFDRANARNRTHNAHNALADIKLCLTILSHICSERHIANVEQLWQFCEIMRIPQTYSFGKYKGEQITGHHDSQYKQWLSKQDNIDEYLKKALQA